VGGGVPGSTRGRQRTLTETREGPEAAQGGVTSSIRRKPEEGLKERRGKGEKLPSRREEEIRGSSVFMQKIAI